MVHPAHLMEVPNACCRVSSAVATIVVSTDIMIKARATMAKISPRRAGMPSLASGACAPSFANMILHAHI
jgi:hypothetical protein